MELQELRWKIIYIDNSFIKNDFNVRYWYYRILDGGLLVILEINIVIQCIIVVM